MSAVKNLIFSAAASLMFLRFVVPLLGINAVESVGGTATVIVVAVFSVSASGLVAEACIWFTNNKRTIFKQTTAGPFPVPESRQLTPAPAEHVIATQRAPAEQPVASTAETVARVKVPKTKVKEMNSKSEQQAAEVPHPMSVATTPNAAQQKKERNHVDVLLGGVS